MSLITWPPVNLTQTIFNFKLLQILKTLHLEEVVVVWVKINLVQRTQSWLKAENHPQDGSNSSHHDNSL